MAKTIYTFQSDLKGLQKLNAGLKEAQANLAALKKGTQEYAAASKNVGGMKKSFQESTKAIKETTVATQQLNSSGNKMIGIFKSASIAIVSAFAFRAIIGGLRGVITTFSNFETQMAAVRAISGATDEEFKKLTESALKLGSSTVFTATQVAQLQEEFARLGFSTKEILAAQNATLDLSAATGESLPKAAAIAGSSLRAFGLEAEQVQRVVNTMGASFTNSALNLERFTQSMKFVAPVGKAAGFTIEETTALLMNLSDAGLHGSIAGNALKNIFIRLGDSSSELNKRIGHSVQGLPQMIDVLRRMKEESFDLTDAVELLDKRSAPAFLALLENIDGLESNLDTLNNAEGVISQMAAIRLDTLEGDFTLLKSAAEGLAVEVGEGFSLSMRQAVFSLTEWIRKLNEGGRFVTLLKTALTVLRGVIIGVTVRFMALKAVAIGKWAIGIAKNIRAVSAALIAMRGAGASASAAVFQLKFAMDALKVSIASTGVGALVVGLGMLIDKLFFTGEEIGELQMKMARMQQSFNDDIESVLELNAASQERHDMIRKINTSYPELIGNIDLEIASNEELVEVLKLVNETEGLRLAMAANKDEMADIDKSAWEDIAELQMQIAENDDSLRKRLKMAEDSWEAGAFNSKEIYEDFVYNLKKQYLVAEFNIENNIKQIKKAAADEKAEMVATHDFFVKSLEEKRKENKTYVQLGIELDKTYRLELRNSYLEDLEAFRELTFNKQKIELEVMEKKLEQLQFFQAIGESEAKTFELTRKTMVKGFAEDEELMQQIADNRAVSGAFWATIPDDVREAWFAVTTTLDGTIEAHEKLFAKNNVELSEMLIKVANMRAIMKNFGGGGGPGGVASRETGFRLERTKKKLKELRKIEISYINDQFEHELASNEASYKNQVDKYNKERDLMETNKKSIQNFLDQEHEGRISKRHKQWAADIKANRKNYDFLRNMDAEEWNKLMDVKQTSQEKYLEILQQMMDEENGKIATNKDILLALEKEFENEKANIKMDNKARMDEIIMDEYELELENRNNDISNLRENQELRMNILASRHESERAAEQALVDAKRMTQEEFDLNEAIRRKEQKDNELRDYDEKLAAFEEMYSAMSEVVMAVSANIAQRNIENLESEHEKRTEDLNNTFENELELAQKHGGDTVAMQEAHDNKMEALEDQKNEKIREINRRQFQIEKANNIAMAIINGAQAIAKVTSQTGIGAIVAAPVTAGLIAAQIGTIMAQRFTGAKGGIIPGGDDKFADGGMVVGPSHANGGVKFAVGGRVAELEGGEAVINKRSTAMFRGQLSAMNAAGGGVRFETGGITPGTRAALDGAKGNWSAGDIAELISSSINAQQVYVSESEITSTQSNVGVTESLSNLF